MVTPFFPALVCIVLLFDAADTKTREEMSEVGFFDCICTHRAYFFFEMCHLVVPYCVCVCVLLLLFFF